MWGTSSPEDKLAGDLGNVIEATSTGGRRSDFFTAEKLAPGNLGLLQQNLPQPDIYPLVKTARVGGCTADYLPYREAPGVLSSRFGPRHSRFQPIPDGTPPAGVGYPRATSC
jgi:hypothetical protein